MKAHDLCRIGKVCPSGWVKKEAGPIRKRYFTGTFAVGKGRAD